MAMNWLQNDNGGDGTQQLPPWLQAIIKNGAAGGMVPNGANAPVVANTPAPTAAPQNVSPDASQQDTSQIPALLKRPDDQDAATPNSPAPLPDWLTGKLPSVDSAAPAAPAPSAVDQLHAAEQNQNAPEPPPPSLNVPGAPNTQPPNWLSQPSTDTPSLAPPEHAQVPGRPRGPFDKIPDGQPGADSWRNQHNDLRKGLALVAAGLAEFGGRDPWGSNGHPGEGTAILQPWLQSEAAKREYDTNLPAMQQQADLKMNQANADVAAKQAQANSQFVFDPATGRYVPVKVAVAQTNAQPKMLQAGYNPVTGKPLTEEETSRAANAKVELDQSHKELYEAQQAQATAKADLDKAQNDPNSPVYQLKLKQYEMTQKRFQLAQERVNLAYRNFGVNTYGIDFGNNSGLQGGGSTAPTGSAPSSAPNGAPAKPGMQNGIPQGNDNQSLAPNGPAIKAAKQSMASGEDHKAVLAFNTASGHLSQLQDAIDALHNGDVTALNKIANKYGVATGQAAPVVFDAIRNAVAGEVGKVFKGQVTDTEVEHIADTLRNEQSPDSLSGVVKADANLMMSKLSAVHDSYYGTVGEHPYVLFPEGAKAFQKLGVELPSWSAAASTPTNRTKQPEAPATGGGQPAGATMKVPGSDGKLHWSDGKNDLGVVQ